MQLRAVPRAARKRIFCAPRTRVAQRRRCTKSTRSRLSVEWIETETKWNETEPGYTSVPLRSPIRPRFDSVSLTTRPGRVGRELLMTPERHAREKPLSSLIADRDRAERKSIDPIPASRFRFECCYWYNGDGMGRDCWCFDGGPLNGRTRRAEQSRIFNDTETDWWSSIDTSSWGLWLFL